MASTFKISDATVVTVVPASTKTGRQFHNVTVDASIVKRDGSVMNQMALFAIFDNAIVQQMQIGGKYDLEGFINLKIMTSQAGNQFTATNYKITTVTPSATQQAPQQQYQPPQGMQQQAPQQAPQQYAPVQPMAQQAPVQAAPNNVAHMPAQQQAQPVAAQNNGFPSNEDIPF